MILKCFTEGKKHYNITPLHRYIITTSYAVPHHRHIPTNIIIPGQGNYLTPVDIIVKNLLYNLQILI